MTSSYESTPTQYGINTYGTSQYGQGDHVDSDGPNFVGHQVEILSSSNVYFPEGRTVWNEFDEHGLIVGLQRLKTENNANYKRRLKDVFANRANASYRGLINGITRELGLDLFQPISINPRRSLANGRFFAPDPYIKFDGAYLFLYSDYKNGILDYQIDRFEPGGNYEHLGNLVDFINTTTYFEASLEDSSYNYVSSMSIFNQSNRETVLVEDTQESNKFRLLYPYVVNGSFLSNDSSVFSNEVSSETLVTKFGRYYIDYTQGLIRLFSIPEIGTVIRYEYNVFPFKPLASPILLYDINSENFRLKLFEQVLNNDSSYSYGLPTELGTDIINELFTTTPMYWGI